MADDRIHPSTAAALKPTFPPSKAQLYNSTRPLYRPQPPPRRRRRCCSFCLCLLFLLVALILLAAVAAAVFYLIYKPHPPSFSVHHLNLTSSSLSLSLSARNPNSKLAFVYDPISVSVSDSSDSSTVSDGGFPGFEHKPGNVTVLRTTLGVKSGETKVLKGKKEVMGEIQVETKAGVRVGGVKSKKVGIRVRCDGVDLMGKKDADVKCKVRVRVKVWKWNL